MVHDYNKFKLGVKEGDELMVIEPWKSSMGTKGQLQQAWFKVCGIPIDQRGLCTIAKIGGLVGKTVSIDEQTRFRHDYVRVKVACRDIRQVPPSAECNLGMFIYDFFFELEDTETQEPIPLNTATKVGDPDEHPSSKKMRTEESLGSESQKGKSTEEHPKGSGKGVRSETDHLSRKFGSAPSKLPSHGNLKSTSSFSEKGLGFINMEGGNTPIPPDDEIIPAAMYEPNNDTEREGYMENSDDSEGFAEQVNKMFNKEGESSKHRESLWRVSSLSEQEVDRVNQHIFENKKGRTLLSQSQKSRMLLVSLWIVILHWVTMLSSLCKS
ncbi:hypothetical protein PVAP13_5NG450180 [Panicum virgatum]|uniref:DUF4283 domain-containing protein n=1 Tax=Panicum virgatum TaxID=38727 RepID=A0A8T0S1V9_PANVG|nr:hypothetical protein PVAP13_5NG450180 [Panicum virgatum]